VSQGLSQGPYLATTTVEAKTQNLTYKLSAIQNQRLCQTIQEQIY